LPWTFALSGETAAGHAVLRWAEKHGLTADGALSAGPAYGNGRFAAYPLGHLTMGALLLERHDVAARLFKQLRAIQDASGGFPVDPPGGEAAQICDLLSTAQVGIAALLGGQRDLADAVYTWIERCFKKQPELPARLYVACRGEDVVTAPPRGLEWVLSVDFTKPRQAYFYPGIAAVFLAGYAGQRGERRALALAHQYLALNIQGTTAQFDDMESVQICKFGWGAAAAQLADPSVDYSEHVRRMGNWFIAHQSEDGSWTPSAFFSPKPALTEVMTKTAEHAMEINAVAAALAVLPKKA
jgi:hypothetical protein